MLVARESGDEIALRELLADAVREAGTLALGKFRTSFKSWTKDKASPVSEVDVAVDELLRKRLAAGAPDYGLLSEETADDGARIGRRRVWIIDPIDGTRAFIAGLPDWTVVAALVEDGRPIVAAVFAPFEDAMYTAALGAGTLLNGRKVRATSGATLEGARVAGPHRRLDALAHVVPSIEKVAKVHSLALRLARVASGELDIALVGPSSHDWDLAAADLLVHEAGGALTTLDGKPVIYNRPAPVHDALYAAGRACHATLLDFVRRHPAEFA